MEEREALKREIELLQNLIDKHKSVHGDVPFARVPPSTRGHTAAVGHPHSSRGRLYAPQSSSSWRKTYSLSNKNPQPHAGHPSANTSSSVHHSGFSSASQSSSLPSHSRGARTSTSSSGISQQRREGQVSCVTGISGNTDTLRKTAMSHIVDERGDSCSTGTKPQQEILHRRTQESKHAVLPEPAATTSAVKVRSSSSLQAKPSLTIKTSADAKQTVNTTTGHTVPPPSALPKLPQPSINPTPRTSQPQVGSSFMKKSKFTWVKTQNVALPKQASSISPLAPKAASKAGVGGGSPPLVAVSRKTPVRKLPRKQSPLTVASKTSKYRWVSSSVGAQAKVPRKSPSPKALIASQRATEKVEATRRLRTAATPSPKMKKETGGSSAHPSLSSRYRWKAGGPSTSGTSVTGGATLARRRSAFHWTSDRNNKGVRGAGSLSVTQRTSLTPPPASSPGGFKLRSRMKIIRKSPSSGGGSERGTSPSAARFSPRGRVHSYTRSPAGARRTPTRELVSFGRHKLRRLSPSFSRTSSASSLRGPASPREFGPRYKTRPGPCAAHAPHYNPALSWRAKRIQTARSFLQSRLRAPHDRHPPSAQHWRGSSMCWIRGSLYRVSANKLSRTAASSMSINRTGRSFGSNQVSPTMPAFTRPSSTRHLASRAVQRSLAIIRHAQKKQPKQYCMYYNRFGKCNRGNSCPYIHDPDKVAVCTRFLRGTCKQADGTCPFSHKVAKEKMPVCSYFLKGICNNSDCPYSHVYVSRKAEVCEDFVKGYCPEGEKCKKKHTLVCPDFSKTGSCPRGSRCKLQHRQRAAKRSAGNTSTTGAKKARSKEPSKRPRLSVSIPQRSQEAPGTPTKGSLALPSFISLSSSPEEAEAPDTQLAETSQFKEKKLQIKPRL